MWGRIAGDLLAVTLGARASSSPETALDAGTVAAAAG